MAQKRRSGQNNQFLKVLIILLAAILCALGVLLTVLVISDQPKDNPTDPTSKPAVTTTVPTASTTVPGTTAAPTEPPIPSEAMALMEEANFIAAGYDYISAIKMLEESPYYSQVPEMASLVAAYKAKSSRFI